MNVLEVRNLCKKYPAFTLDHVSFSLESGKITGFIGRNGAGKSTTLNSLFRFVQPDSGSVRFFGMEFDANQLAVKQKVGFLSGAVDYYPKKKLKSITGVTKMFYANWDSRAYSRYMDLFRLDENKTPDQLSAGMKVKYALTLAMSHGAELLILDEPTSGLDPVSRDELIGIFLNLSDEGKSILFSTHITSDLDSCADNIIYIKNGAILAESEISAFVNGYVTVEFTEEALAADSRLIGAKRSKHGYTALLKSADAAGWEGKCTPADLESIMIHMEARA